MSLETKQEAIDRLKVLLARHEDDLEDLQEQVADEKRRIEEIEVEIEELENESEARDGALQDRCARLLAAAGDAPLGFMRWVAAEVMAGALMSEWHEALLCSLELQFAAEIHELERGGVEASAMGGAR